MKFTLAAFAIILSLTISAQHAHDEPIADAHSLGEFFKLGTVHGHIRNYSMATFNDGSLRDYATHAIGGAIKVESARYQGFSVGLKGIFTYAAFHDNLIEEDRRVGKSAKWEKELYDFTRPEESHDLDRLEELFIHYKNDVLDVHFGKIDINDGPLFLRRDGRMKPFVYRGIWSQWRPTDRFTLHLGWIEGVSPRGTTRWYSMNEAIGITSRGVQPNGQEAQYHELAETRGIGVLKMDYASENYGKFEVANFFFHNLFQMTWTEWNKKWGEWYTGVQYVFQSPLPAQGSLPYNGRYMQPDERAHVVSARLGFILGNLDLSMSYLRAFDTGRFLYPRELGRENFFASQQRSWIDGLGDVDVAVLRAKWIPSEKSNWDIDSRLGYTWVGEDPDQNYNKYGWKSFWQLTLASTYHFENKLKGLSATLLYVGKFQPIGANYDLASKFYRYDLHHLNFITNITFG